jgi:hypothetical protein
MKFPKFFKSNKQDDKQRQAEGDSRYIRIFKSSQYSNAPICAIPSTDYSFKHTDSDGREINDDWHKSRWQEMPHADCSVSDALDASIINSGALQASRLWKQLEEGEGSHVSQVASAETSEEPYFDEVYTRVTTQITKFDEDCCICEQINKMNL